MSSADKVLIDKALTRVDELSKELKTKVPVSDTEAKAGIVTIRDQYSEIRDRLNSVIEYHNSSAEDAVNNWKIFRGIAISLSALAATINIVGAAIVIPWVKTLAAALAAALTVIVGSVTAWEATMKWRERHLGSSELRDAFFGLVTTIVTIWNVHRIAEEDSPEAFLSASAILLYAVEEENLLRDRFNRDLHEQFSPSPGGSEKQSS